MKKFERTATFTYLYTSNRQRNETTGNMKRFFITLVTAIVLAVPAMAQKASNTGNDVLYRHDPNLVNGTKPTSGDEVVAFSDTTMNTEEGIAEDTLDAAALNTSTNYTLDDVSDPIRLIAFLSEMGGVAGALIAITVAVVCLLVFLSPVWILALIIYFLTRNRNKKYKIIENAIEKGQPIPTELLRKNTSSNDRLWSAGIRHAAIGVGVVAFGMTVDASFFIGIGFILFFYGVGQAIVARTSAERRRKEPDYNEYEDITDDNEDIGRK